MLSQLSYRPDLTSAAKRSFAVRAQLVGLGRVELPTFPLSGERSSQLSYRPFLSKRLNSVSGPSVRPPKLRYWPRPAQRSGWFRIDHLSKNFESQEFYIVKLEQPLRSGTSPSKPNSSASGIIEIDSSATAASRTINAGDSGLTSNGWICEQAQQHPLERR